MLSRGDQVPAEVPLVTPVMNVAANVAVQPPPPAAPSLEVVIRRLLDVSDIAIDLEKLNGEVAHGTSPPAKRRGLAKLKWRLHQAAE